MSDLETINEGGSVEVGSSHEGIGFYLAKIESDSITFFVATNTNLFPVLSVHSKTSLTISGYGRKVNHM